MYVMEKTTSGWSQGKPLITIKDAGPRPTVAENGNIYVPIFDRSQPKPRMDVFVLKLKDGVYQSPERLPDSVNSGGIEEHLYVAPDESYLLFDSDRAGGLGKSDIYISFHKPDGSWSQARNLGAPINTPGFDYNSRVSPDGKYLFYFSAADGQLRWTDFQALVKNLKADK
jgi:Tol biopolymer transport system component